MPWDKWEFPLEVREEIRQSISRTFIPYRGQIYKKSMTLHPFGDNFNKRREKYPLSGAICCEKKGSKGERCAIIWEGYPTMCEKMAQLRGENCWKNAQHFWRNTACAAVGIQKMPPKGGMSLWLHSRGNGAVRVYRELDVRMSQTRGLDFSN